MRYVEYQEFITGYWPIPLFFLLFPVGAAIALFYLLNYDMINLGVSIGISLVVSLGLSIEYWFRLRSTMVEQTMTKYVDQFETMRALTTSLISVVGIFISILGTGALFGDASLTLPIILAFSTLILSLFVGFLSLAEITDAVDSQEDSKLCITSTKWSCFWFSARYQLTLFIYSIIFLVAGITLSTPPSTT